jgi:hypothetical protein
MEIDSTQLPMDDPALVARRALIMAAVVCRSHIEGEPGLTVTQELHSRVLEWLTKLELWPEVEAHEEKWLRAPLGEMKPKDVNQARWYVEGLAVLAWALNQQDFPLHDQKVDPYAVAESLKFLSEGADQFILTAQLRSPVEIEAARELLYAIHCRLVDFRRNSGSKDFTDWIEKAWLTTLGLDAAHLIANNDLAVGGKTLSEGEPEQVRHCEYLTNERHKAIIWLAEGPLIYSQVAADT